MIRKMLIQGFQAHEKLMLKFTPGVNIIVGRTDVGKSSIIRALSWALRNTPKGDFFIRDDKCSVKVDINGKTVTRSRGKALNTYHLGKEEYVAFGHDVPEPIQKVVNISDVNFQGQHDTAFWFGESKAEVNRRLNDIVNLGIIDSTLSRVNNTLRNLKSKKDVVEERIEEAATYVEEWGWLHGFYEKLTHCVDLNNTIVDKEEALEDLEARIEELNTKTAELHDTHALNLDSSIAKVEEAQARLNNIQGMLTSLENMVNDIAEKEAELKLLIAQQRKLNHALTHAKVDRTGSGVCPTCGRAF